MKALLFFWLALWAFVICGILEEWGLFDVIQSSDNVAMLYQISGYAAFILLIAALVPIRACNILKKQCGFACFAAAVAHCAVFVWVDFDFYIEAMLEEFDKYYMQYGIAAFLFLCIAFGGSAGHFGYVMRACVCIALALAILHYIGIQKILSVPDILLLSIAIPVGMLGIWRLVRMR